jgi:hypothetical protein
MPQTATNTVGRITPEVSSPRSVEPDNQADEKLIVGYEQLSIFLIEQHYPLSKSTVSKICSPAINTGPPAEGLWGRLPTFKPSRVLDWARKSMCPVGEARAFVPQKPKASAPKSVGSARGADKRIGKVDSRAGKATAGE